MKNGHVTNPVYREPVAALFRMTKLEYETLVELLGRYSKFPALPQFTLEPCTARRTGRPRESTPNLPRKRHKIRQRLSPAQQTDLIERYTTGASMNELVAAFQLSKGAVHGLLEDAGVTRRMNIPTASQVAEAERLYVKESWSLKRIGQHLGYNTATIHRHLKRRGVVMRRPWERPMS